ncbi:hypothetical protein KSP40_PGU016540 [Platanthera guangdongensis]|uniref:Uncharacterized protein n=1 Tax=Platanthera guangdongensis TaxID=2320717 RepID=A0ABR2LIA7_9ASPA
MEHFAGERSGTKAMNPLYFYYIRVVQHGEPPPRATEEANGALGSVLGHPCGPFASAMVKDVVVVHHAD